MWTDKVIFVDILSDGLIYLPRFPVFIIINLFPLQTPEIPLGNGVVGCPAFAVHADLDTVVFQ